MKYVYYDKYYNTRTIRAALTRLFVAATISAKNVLFANKKCIQFELTWYYNLLWYFLINFIVTYDIIIVTQ